MELTNATYDRLKFFVMIVCPGIATAYLGLDLLWDLPKETEVAGTIAVVATFLGIFLRKSAQNYDGAGDLIVTTDPVDGASYLSTDLNEHPAQFKEGTNVVMNIKRRELED